MRWLHCSDFHVGKDRTAQEVLLGRIVEQVKHQVASGFVPDLIFITGDIANNGVKREYETFRKTFLQPLRDALGGNEWNGQIFAVPGNHDVDRLKNNTFDRDAPLAGRSQFFDPSKTGKLGRDILAPRFKAYRQGAVGDLSGDWVSKAEGAFSEKITINGSLFGVVGINTAWLSKDQYDQLKLSPGVELVEAALQKIKDCPIRFVLGHHPLTWLHEEHARRLRALFGLHKVIYLHGHLHRADGSQEDGAGNNFIILQSGAAFQARDGEPWRNGLLWGEIDIISEQIRLSPRYWNPDNYDWPVETGRFPEKRRIVGTDWWAYDLPLTSFSDSTAKLGGWRAPSGWEVLTFTDLQRKRHEVTVEEAGRFFDGAEPDWGLALCPELPSRTIVGRLSQEIIHYRDQERPLAILLTGPGGEGKSMVLRQAVAAVLALDSQVNVLWHIDETSVLPSELIAQLPKGPWLIATDAADLVAKSLIEAASALQRNYRSDVRFLLCARDTDWRACGAEKLIWNADYRVHNLSGLTEEDAELIACAWATFEGNKSTVSNEEWVEKSGRALFEATRANAAVSEGSLLGGVLVVRHGQELRAHVARLMDRLREYPLSSGGSLYDAFAYIAVMHAEGFDFMSRPVLASVLNCDSRKLGQEVIVPLAREAAASGGSVLLTRHRRIAEAAVLILEAEFGENIADRFEELARAAKAARANAFIPQYARWEYDLPENFIEKNAETAVRIGRALLEVSHENANLAVNLARIYRKCGDPSAGADLLSHFTGDVDNDRGFWREWGICIGSAGDKALSAMLGGWSLADQPVAVAPNTKDAKLGLASLGLAFGELYEQYRNTHFIEGVSSVAYLGLKLSLDPQTRGYLEKYKKDAECIGVEKEISSLDAIARIRVALTDAWGLCGKQRDLLSQLVSPSAMTFEGLARLFAY